ncbi:hypothetical protein M8C13_19270 [Crossiella sp. SN42]|uniref:hypothetical protein n=1 Tax=Crossiella sp. SN42 TaxID=2944808 RepID=UPI00207C1749|nr:hypothetical protein [Crossiella sp. SN42]MCO1577898.1 hypothetical protein [Crossiella sp. SN42]
MNKIRTALAGAATALAALAVVPAQAQAAAEPAPTGVQASGQMRYCNGLNRTNFCGGYLGNVSNLGACRNRMESLHNDGHAGALDDVWVHWGTNYSGARRGVHRGVILNDLRQWHFDPITGPGSGQALWHNISSHRSTQLG